MRDENLKNVVVVGNYIKIRDSLIKIAQFPEKPFIFMKTGLTKWGNGEIFKFGYRVESSKELIDENYTIFKFIIQSKTGNIQISFKAISSVMESKIINYLQNVG